MSFRQTVGLAVVVSALLVAGCAESPELGAAKKISKDLAQARDLIGQQTPDSYARAEQLLRETLKTRDATMIAKQGANELLATLLSEVNARQFTSEEFADLQRKFGQADSHLYYAFSKLSAEAAGFAYSLGLAQGNSQTLAQYRQKLAGMVPQATTEKDHAESIRIAMEKKLILLRQQVYNLRVEANTLFVRAESLSDSEHVSAVAQAAGKQLEADRLAIDAQNVELALQTAQQDELARKAELAKLQETLQSVETQISSQDNSADEVRQAGVDAKDKIQGSADELAAHLKAFDESGANLATAYQGLIERQGQAITHYGDALNGAADKSAKFRKYKSDQPAEAPADERVAMLTPADAQVDLAVGLVRAEILRASIRKDYAGLVEQMVRRGKQIDGAGKSLAMIGVQISMAQAATTSTEELYAAAKEGLSSAITKLRSAALSRDNEKDTAEEIVKKLERQTQWNWQVWAMLGLAHQARAGIYQQMGDVGGAQADSQEASVYLSNANRARPGLVGLAGSN